MQDYQLLLDARQHQADLQREAAEYHLSRSLSRTSQLNLLQSARNVLGVRLIRWGEQLQRPHRSAPAAPYLTRHMKHPSL